MVAAWALSLTDGNYRTLCMKTDISAFLSILYVHLDDRIMPALGFVRDHHPGRKPAFSQVGLLCLIVAQQKLRIASERKWIRFAHNHLKGIFPTLTQQSRWSKRVRQGTGVLLAVITELARDLLGRDHTADRLHPGALRQVPRNSEMLRPCRSCGLRPLRFPFLIRL